ncbi:hypothetical protein [Flavobacterium oreochromis]|uniref:Lipoprotein n=3 Tax=Flavobacterium TaxID=237 RepID=A0A246G7H2_9FLAO|nr:hypothetical protein [Flavobacterium oreochromis]OWP74435.1 hypothetical protein BWK62_14370 [Flavobacterium oreochromis]OWP74442.1 hypothetical protein BWG23_13850 [Flavobacterium oreochromis]
MKKNILWIPLILMILSCSNRNDLEKIKFNSTIKIENTLSNYEKTTTSEYGFKSYTSVELDNLKFGDVSLNSFKVKDGYPYGENQIWVLVSEYSKNIFLGVELNLNNEKGTELLNYLKKIYGAPDIRKDPNSNAYFWDSKEAWIILKQKEEFNKKNQSYTQTTFSFLKKGIRVENSEDKNVFTILDTFNLTYPK